MDGVNEFAPVNVANYPSLEKVLALQSALAELPQVDCPVKHHFSKGVYAREFFQPAGVAVVGYMHRTEHLFILAKGDLTVTTDAGMQRLRGPCVINTLVGMKRALYAHEDTTLITIHVTDETDPDKIMADILVPEPGSPLQDFHAGAKP